MLRESQPTDRATVGDSSRFSDDVIGHAPGAPPRRLTRNQTRAVTVAKQLVCGQIDESNLTDADWHLLLLGAGLNDPRARTLLVAERVLRRATHRSGYFAPDAIAAAAN